MNIFCNVVFFSGLPLIFVIFMVLRPRHAVVACTVGYWLFMPSVALPISGFPDYSKASMLSVGLVIATMIFDPRRFLDLRWRWYDLPMAVFCLVPMISMPLNSVPIYDALAALLKNTILWGCPYLLGRAYFSDKEGLLELAMGIVAGGVLYVPLCLYEIRMSPQLNRRIYGFSQSSFFMTLRGGGYRPLVFLATGLEVGLYMAASTVVSYGLWTSGAVRRFLGVPMSLVFFSLLVTTILCKSSGALTLMIASLCVFWLAKRLNTRTFLWCIVLVAPLYLAYRISGLVDTAAIVNRFEQVLGSERAESLAFRFDHEDRMLVNIRQRLIWGAGLMRGFAVRNANGETTSIFDSLWILILGLYGIVGLTALTATQVLPCILWLRRPVPKPWCHPSTGAAAGLMLALTMHSIDNLANAMYSPVYFLISGGLCGFRLGAISRTWQDWIQRGRALKQEGRPREAAEAWQHALAMVSSLPDGRPGRVIQGDLHNDLAWLLCHDPRSPAFNPTAALHAAALALEANPDHLAAWNTLGMARLRCGDLPGAIQALERSIERGGGDAFDHFPLSMAYRGLGRNREADAALEAAILWTQTHQPDHPDLLRFWTETADPVASPRS